MVTEFEAEDPTVDEVRFPLRAFHVTCGDGRLLTVFAHRHENNNVGGHLNFITDHPDERGLISRAFHSAVWREVEEVFDPKILALGMTQSTDGVH